MGCWIATYNTPIAFPLFYLWPPVLSLITVVYGMLAFRAFLKRRNSMVQDFLNSDASGLSADRYFRIMCFAAAEIVTGFPLTLYMTISHTVNDTILPWKSWANTHSNWNRFDRIPAIIIESNDNARTTMGVYLWLFPYLCLLFFVFFGVGPEQLNQYRRWFYAILRPFGVKPPPPKPYDRSKRTWWQRVFRLRQPSNLYGSNLTSSHGPAHSGRGVVDITHSEKPIPSARSANPLASVGTALTFDMDDEKSDIKHPLPHDLEAGASKGLDSFDDEHRMYSKGPGTSSASSVTGPGDANQDVHAIETSAHRIA
jgi:hypothetical protein